MSKAEKEPQKVTASTGQTKDLVLAHPLDITMGLELLGDFRQELVHAAMAAGKAVFVSADWGVQGVWDPTGVRGAGG